MVKLVDTADSKSAAEKHTGSIPVLATNNTIRRSGGTGRRWGLKILGPLDVRVRFPSPPPNMEHKPLGCGTGIFPGEGYPREVRTLNAPLCFIQSRGVAKR